MQQQDCWTSALKKLDIDVFCMHDTRIWDSSPVISLTKPDSFTVNLYTLISEKIEATACTLTEVNMFLNERVKSTPL